MTRDMQEFFGRRAEHLAIVYLTRRDDLVVNRVVSPSGAADFLVDVVNGGESTGRVFGVRVKAVEHAVGRGEDLSPCLGELPTAGIADAPMPYCVFVFTMEDDRGYFSWLKEPARGSRSAPRLDAVREARWCELDTGGMDRLVRSVNVWYDAQRRPQAA